MSQSERVRAGIGNAQGRLYVDYFMSGWLINKAYVFFPGLIVADQKRSTY